MEIYTTTSPLLYNEHYRLMNMKNEILYSSSTTGMMKAVMKENKNTTNIVEEQTSSPRSVATDIDQILSAPWKENLHHDNTIIFIDYDDTILPSTWLIAEQAKWITAEGIYLNNREKFQNLETRAKNLLEKALSLGNVQLVTNAESGWVEKTVTAFLPGLLGLISKIPCTSARNAYQSAHPDPRVWKLMAFHRTVTEWVDAKTSHILYSTNPDHFEMLNLISIGDSETEREALHVLGSTMQHVVTKSLKLSENPSIETVIHQLDSLSSSLQIFAKHVGHLDLVLRL